MYKLNYNFVTLFGIGNIKVAPGTFGSIFACLILFILFHVLNLNNYLILVFLILITIFAFVSINIYLKNSVNKDPKEVVIDEFVGQSIPIILYEFFHADRSNSLTEALQIYLWFFLLFRLFDGLKPFPIDYVDKKYKNSFGILFDDILAGVYVVICLVLFMIGKTFFL